MGPQVILSMKPSISGDDFDPSPYTRLPLVAVHINKYIYTYISIVVYNCLVSGFHLLTTTHPKISVVRFG